MLIQTLVLKKPMVYQHQPDGNLLISNSILRWHELKIWHWTGPVINWIRPISTQSSLLPLAYLTEEVKPGFQKPLIPPLNHHGSAKPGWTPLVNYAIDDYGGIPGQSWVLQVFVSTSSPSLQAFPGCLGSGLLHVRVRCVEPPAQDLEQADHCPHSAQAPSTTKQGCHPTVHALISRNHNWPGPGTCTHSQEWLQQTLCHFVNQELYALVRFQRCNARLFIDMNCWLRARITSIILLRLSPHGIMRQPLLIRGTMHHSQGGRCLGYMLEAQSRHGYMGIAKKHYNVRKYTTWNR